MEPLKPKFERIIPESKFEKLFHFYDTRMTFRKREIKTTLTCISEEKNKQVGRMEEKEKLTLSYTLEYMNTSSSAQWPLILFDSNT